VDGRDVDGSEFVEALFFDELGVDSVDVVSLHFVKTLVIDFSNLF